MNHPSDQKVLIVAADPLLAALVGSVVELSRLRAAFPKAGERPEDALSRVKPLLAVLVDALMDESESDLFLARARKRGVHVVLFGGARAIEARRAWAAAGKVQLFSLPADVTAFESAIQALATTGWKPERVTERRAARGAPLTFDDAKGKRWSVYDRRTNDRRRPEVSREFVSDSGEVRHCRLTTREAELTSIEALTSQLARSTEGKDL